jgi:hypothetical protein
MNLQYAAKKGSDPALPRPQHSYFPARRSRAERNFQILFLMEELSNRAVQLASTEPSAYTDFVAIFDRSSGSLSVNRQGLARRRGHVFHGDPA